MQLFGDTHGNVVHFGTRDCSSQRRHQKLLEEAPAPFLDSETRERIHNAAVLAAKSVGYYNAGTAEFLVKGRDFYFLEINTRIQVEHPVTEAVTGVDLVQLQLKVAMGERLPLLQDQIKFLGHAIELRINAEDVTEGFRPAIGTITEVKRPDAIPGGIANATTIREDCGYRVGDSIPPFYDSLISKVILHAPTRQEAIYNLFQFLKGYRISGVPTTIPFHAWILANPDFQGDGIDIGYVERHFIKDSAARALALITADPKHQSAAGSSKPHSEVLPASEYAESKLPANAKSVLITHEPGGTFLAVPLDAAGNPLERSLWRRSNTRRGALAF